MEERRGGGIESGRFSDGKVEGRKLMGGSLDGWGMDGRTDVKILGCRDRNCKRYTHSEGMAEWEEQRNIDMVWCEAWKP